LLPRSPDPLLGKATLYLYVARDPERAEQCLKEASARDYPFTASVRWVHMLADTYTQRARILENEAAKLEEVLPDQTKYRLSTAVAYVEKAIQWYSVFPIHGNAIKKIQSCRAAIERLNGKLANMQSKS
jgi:hypothetical protein